MRLRGLHSERVVFPGVAEAADGFAEADGEVHNGLEALGVHGRETLAVSVKHLGVAEDSRERIIDLGAENRANIARQFGSKCFRRGFPLLRAAHSALDRAGGRGDEISGARHEFDFSRDHEGCDFRLPI